MIHALFAAVLLAAAPEPSLEGLYAAIGGGGSLLIVPGDNTFGYDAELRVGYSFNPMLQLYLSGSVDGGTFSTGHFRSEQVLAFVQYHIIKKVLLKHTNINTTDAVGGNYHIVIGKHICRAVTHSTGMYHQP